MVNRLGQLIATCGPVGYAPIAPGTFGSAAGLLLFWVIRWLGWDGLELAAVVVLTGLGVWSATVAERSLGMTDPGPVVIDEVVGMLVTLAFIPVGIVGALVGFVLFRIMDVVKPWPASKFESWHGGLGVMADDVMAAVYSNLVLRVLVAVAPAWLQ